MNNQAYIFLIFVLNGFLIGILFDFFRILRKSFKTNDFITYLQDIFFWILTGLTLIYSIFKFNNGELRAYILLGLILGISIYILGFSKIFMKIGVAILNFLKKIVNIIFVLPIKYILNLSKKLFIKPIFFAFINIKKFASKSYSRIKKCKNKEKNIKKIFNIKKKVKAKKDFEQIC